MPRKEMVTRVIDGDTFETNRRKNPIRLAGYDASEKGKKGAAQARKDLSAMILGQEIAVEKVATDKYKRTVARVKLGRNSVNKAMKEKLGG